MRMGRGMMSRLVMAWRVLEYNCDDMPLQTRRILSKSRMWVFPWREGFGEDIGGIELTGNIMQFDISDCNLIPRIMIMGVDMFRPVVVNLVGGECNEGLVIGEDRNR